MKVDIVGIYPEDALRHICSIAKICRAESSINEIFESTVGMEHSEIFDWVMNLIKQGHTSILRFAHVCWIFDDVSKVLTHQLVRHQAGIDFMQRSDRHTDPGGVFMPESITPNVGGVIAKVQGIYNRMVENGTPKEDARYILPQGSLTRIACIANIEAIRHIFKVRTNPAAQKEIRDAFEMLADAIAVKDEYLAHIIRYQGE